MTTTAVESLPHYPWAARDIIMCYEHGYEWVPDDAFEICGECFHVYRTEQDLLDAHNLVLFQMGDPPRQTLDFLRGFCAECLHDF